MKIYIILISDNGYLGYGPEIGTGTTIEGVYKSYNDALLHLQKTCENYTFMYGTDEDLKCVYRYFNEEDEHEYFFEIYEKELA